MEICASPKSIYGDVTPSSTPFRTNHFGNAYQSTKINLKKKTFIFSSNAVHETTFNRKKKKKAIITQANVS